MNLARAGAAECMGLSNAANSTVSLWISWGEPEAPALVRPTPPQPTVGMHSLRVGSPAARGHPTARPR